MSEIEVMAKINGVSNTGTWLLEEKDSRKIPVRVARDLVCPNSNNVPVRLLNVESTSVTVYKNTQIATMEQIGEGIDEHTINISTIESHKLLEEKKQMLWSIVERCGKDLSEEQRRAFFHLLITYADVFAMSKMDVGRTGKLKHSIFTGNATPVRQSTRRIPVHRRDEVQKMLKDMLRDDIIEPSNSPWASPIVLVRKKDGSVRMCIDYRKLNAITQKDAFPLPRIDDTLDILSGSKWFSTLDLISGYWQVEVAKEDRDKTAFCTQEGLFEFKVMPFRLCNTPATFQRLMNLVLAGLQWSSCLVYLDDIIIVGSTFEEHMERSKAVLERLRKAGLKLQPLKCRFFQQEVQYLGHVVSKHGISTDPSKIEKVIQWPFPCSKKEVQQFLGFAGYYRRFIRDFSTTARPLHKLAERSCSFNWTEECEQSFNQLRLSVTSAPVLAFPDFSKTFTLDTDASSTGIGAVLSQVHDDGSERVIAYASRLLSKSEQSYCVTRRELLAVVHVLHYFRPYLLGKGFVLRTDHGSLTWLTHFREPEGQLARWLERLQEYDFRVVHRQGKKHTNVDVLSRLPCRQCGRENHDSTEIELGVSDEIVAAIQVIGNRDAKELLQFQLNDPVVGPILRAKQIGEKPTDNAVKQNPKGRRLQQIWEQLVLKNGLLFRKFESQDGTSSYLQWVVPSSLQKEILDELHGGTQSGHLGEEKTLSRLKERFYWPGQWNNVRNWCNTCATCATRKSVGAKNRAPLQTIRAGYPMQVVAVDILGPLPESDGGNSYILVLFH